MSLPTIAITKAGRHHEKATQSQVLALVWTLCKQPLRVIIVYENTMRCLNITGSSTLSLDSAYVLVLQLMAAGQKKDVLWRNQTIKRPSVFAIISPTSPFLCILHVNVSIWLRLKLRRKTKEGQYTSTRDRVSSTAFAQKYKVIYDWDPRSHARYITFANSLTDSHNTGNFMAYSFHVWVL